MMAVRAAPAQLTIVAEKAPWLKATGLKEVLSAGARKRQHRQQQAGMLCLSGLNVDKLAAFLAFGEDNLAVDESEEGVVLTHAYVKAGVVDSATLTLEDVAGFAILTAENLYSESFAF